MLNNFFSSSLTMRPNKLVLVPCKQIRTEEPCPKGEYLKSATHVGSGLTYKHYTWLERPT